MAGDTKRTPKTVDAVGQFPGFYANDHHAYAARKAERLASATHVVTGFMLPDEPLRTVLRTLSLEVVQLVTDPTRLMNTGTGTFGARCAEIGSLLETAESAGLASAMNVKLIVDEYAHLAVFVRDRITLMRAQVGDMSDKGQKDTTQYKSSHVLHISDKGQVTDSRRSDILRLFASRERITIKDAVDAIPSVSEKTLQRELLSMVAEKVLIKEGERRWSTYIRAVETPRSELQ